MTENEIVRCGATRLATAPRKKGPLGEPVQTAEICTAPAEHDGDHDWGPVPTD